MTARETKVCKRRSLT